VAALYMATRPPFWAFVAVQVVLGYGTGLLESALNAYLAKLPSAAVLLNRLHAFFGVGALLGPLLAAWMLGFAPWTAVWLTLTVACLLLIAGFWAGYPRRAPHGGDHGDPRHDAVEPVDASGPAGERAAAAAPDGDAVTGRRVRSRAAASDAAGGGLLAGALRSPAVVLASTFLAVYVGLEVGVGNWAVTFLIDEHGQTALTAGYAVSGYWFGLTLGRFLISPIATRVGLSATGTSFACLIGVAVTAGLIWSVRVPVVAAAGLVLLGFFLGPLFPTAMAVVPNLTTDRMVPTAIGVMNGVSVVGGAVFPWMAGAAAQGVGVWTLMPFALSLAVVQLVLWRLIVARMSPV